MSLIGFDENEVSKNSNGGTELQMRELAYRLEVPLLQEFQIICSRPRELDNSKIRIMFFHDLAGDPEVEKFRHKWYRDKFHHFVFISDWQQQQYNSVLNFPLGNNSSVIEVGFNPIEVDWEKKKSDTIRFCYTSTPQRGLGILYSVFDRFSTTFPDVHLDVFSSFKIYGWDKMDEQFEPLYQQIKDHPKMTYHSYVPHDDLINYLKTAHIFAYPCIWPETSCKAMEEAMSAGLLCVHPNIAALPLTSGYLNYMYMYDPDNQKHANIFYSKLVDAYKFIKTNERATEYLQFVKFYTDNRYNITKITYFWENLLKDLLDRYKTVESRSQVLDNDTFIIDTMAVMR